MTHRSLSKYHATGNDFLVLHAPDDDGVSDAMVIALCDRHTGIGADGLLTIGAPRSEGADCSFRLQNADGGEAEMSGNGMRCLAAAAVRLGYGSEHALRVDTPAGRRDVEFTTNSAGDVDTATVDMGAPIVDPVRIPVSVESPLELSALVDGVAYVGDAVGMGNPHWVVFVDDVASAAVGTHGPVLEHDPRFPNRTNVEFARVENRSRIEMRVWERGVGETRSCGTGASAVAVAAHRRGLVDAEVTLVVPGGRLVVEIGTTIRLSGPVVHVFDVDIELPADPATGAP